MGFSSSLFRGTLADMKFSLRSLMLVITIVAAVLALARVSLPLAIAIVSSWCLFGVLSPPRKNAPAQRIRLVSAYAAGAVVMLLFLLYSELINRLWGV
jgi:hypothetical protein